ncbi:hypothetical protein SNEBB_001640 [Seison nebaliae]|nr:hypothetical protein SNEBB_001640 [Seison nebaliae]
MSLKRIVFSGIQPTGVPHIGNYFGAITLWRDLQEEKDNKLYLSVVDYHSLTSIPPDFQKTEFHDGNKLKLNINRMIASLVASGIHPNKSTLFLQSDVNEHSELQTILNNFTTISRLKQLHHFKEKSKNREEATVGLFTYPILQAADILLYDSTHVPIGEDNVQHVQITRDIARKFNQYTNSEIFVIPQILLNEFSKINSLRRPEEKMSKSSKDKFSTISIIDEEEEISKKIRKSVTDSISDIYYDEKKRPGISNLLKIHSLMTKQSIDDIISQLPSNIDTFKYKRLLTSELIEHFKPIRSIYKELLSSNEKYLEGELYRTIKTNGEMAKEIASKKMRELKKLLGMFYY